jgi:hypothetical protein
LSLRSRTVRERLFPRRSACLAKGAAVSEIFRSIEPLKDPRWEEFVQRHPRSSIFHTTAWLAALQRSYGYEPLAFTSAAEGEPLSNGVVFSRVRSWLVRPRLVGLPFSDHTEPLLNDDSELDELFAALDRGRLAGKWRKIELRPLQSHSPFLEWTKFQDGRKYLLHTLDLRPSIDELFRALHKDSIQRKIRRAAREGVLYEEGRSEGFLRTFYDLTSTTALCVVSKCAAVFGRLCPDPHRTQEGGADCRRLHAPSQRYCGLQVWLQRCPLSQFGRNAFSIMENN